ncbi:MAG TPA: RiPP maturation radical SAM C-methyltransferase [Candidatus Angelobacter sp.]|nr:RiPP maturation radical SAM C-methyltransferase [Candidatus Angelobacter sp.]
MDLVFVVTPFADLGRPAIGVSLLKAAVLRAGFSAIIQYCNFDLGELIGEQLYQNVASSFPPELLVGEWFFAEDLFGDEIPDEDEYIEKILMPFASAETIHALRNARKLRNEYLDRAARRIAAIHPRIVGFTTTFHQTCASLAIARRLKALPMPPIIVFGGANCEGEMGLQMLQSFQWIDHVCCGESDISFMNLLDHLFCGGPGSIPGVLTRGKCESVTASQPVLNMDSLPFPDYDDYFEQLDNFNLGKTTDTHLLIESSRGCWWGAKHHCTFCGLNGETMTFRSKSPERAFQEILFLCNKHKRYKIAAVDNILDMRYIDTLFPRIASSGIEPHLFYEVKANFRYDQLVKLHRGGIRQIQPGIESLSNQVLRLMEKGVTGFQNIQLLRWCEELEIECAWNLLAGFPGESPGEYTRMAELLPLLAHLHPPLSCAQLRLDRFSPFHFRAESFGLQKIRASRAYFYVFPLGRREMGRLAYFFDFDYHDGRKPQEYLAPVQKAVGEWWDSRVRTMERPRLDAEFKDDEIVVTDTRKIAHMPRHCLSGVRAKLLSLCDSATTVAALTRQPGMVESENEIRAGLESLVASKLMACDQEHYLTLAVFRNRSTGSPGYIHNADFSISKTATA